jgi:predicted nuclease of predicted toxin-antitoxin system
MRFLVDAQLPPALVGWLAAGGHEAEHVGDRKMQTASDAAIWDYALATSAVIVTKDEDFAQRKVLTAAGPAVVSAALTRTRQTCAMLASCSTSVEINGSPCPKCRVPMMLGRVTPEPPDFDLYTFMCPECEYLRCVAVGTADRWFSSGPRAIAS